MRASSNEKKPSLKKQTVQMLDQFLLGYISPKDLINAAAPMLIVSQSKRGRKNYIEKYLMELSGKTEQELTREYIYKIRETIRGDVVTSEKDRAKVFRRTLRKLLERFIYEEIEEAYFLSMLSDIMVDYDLEIQAEPDVKVFFAKIQTLFSLANQTKQAPSVINVTLDFYDSFFKGLWDE